MPISYRIDRELNIVLGEWAGDIDTITIESYYKALIHDPVAFNCRKSLDDIRQANFALKGESFFALLKAVVEPAVKTNPWKSAILVSRLDQFGTARQFDVYAENIVESQIFRDRQEALSWLCK